MSSSGIYKIENKKDKKVYIGSALDIKGRFRSHKYALRHNKHRNQHLQRAWNRDSESSFLFEILEEGVSRENLLSREMYYVLIYDALDSEKGYNFLFPDRRKGEFHHTEDAKRKISEAGKGRKGPPRSEEFKKELSKRCKGRTYEERYGEAQALQIKEKIRNANFKREYKRGFHFSDETRKKLSESHKGLFQSEEKRKKCSEAKKVKIEEETRDTIKSMILEGFTKKKITERTGCSTYLINRVLRE